MSVRWSTWAWDQATDSSGQRLVLLALADHAGEDGLCYPGTASLAEKCGFGSTTTVRNHLDALEGRGLVQKVHRRRRKNGTLSTWLYRLGGAEAPPVHPEDHPEDTSATGVAVDQRHHSTPTTASGLAVGQRHPTGAHEPSGSEPSGEPPVPPTPTELDAEFDGFWRAYPRKVARPKARTAYTNARRHTTKQAIAQGLGRWLRYWEERNEPEYVPHPTTWLNQHRWDDYPPAAGAPATGHARTRDVLDRLADSEQPEATVHQLRQGGAA